jgi:hypothetical protein
MGLSSSKTKTKSTTSSTPLDQYAPYITQGLTTAQGVLNDNQANLNQMSQSAYGLYNGLANSIANGSGFVNGAQNIAANLYNGGGPGAATYQNLQQASAHDPSLGLLGKLSQGSNAYDAIGTSNPALGLLQGMTNQAANPDSAGYYKDVLGGKYLDAGNPYLGAMLQQSDDAVTKAANQRFAAAGMGAGLSTPYMDVLTRNLTNGENMLRYQDYDNQLNRMTQVGAQSDAGYNAAQDRSLSAASNMGNLYNSMQQTRLQAQQAHDQQQLDAAKAWGTQSNADNQTALDAANGSVDAIIKALQQAPGLADAQYAGVTPALSALQAAASIPYTGVNNYAGLVNGLTGKYGNETTNSTQTTSGNIGQMLSGLAGSALSSFVGSDAFGTLLNLNPKSPLPTKSDVRAKRDIRRIGTLDDGLGIYAYRYLWDDEPRIGVMAQEVAGIRPWALGPIQDGYMTVDYGAL